ncbi:MAG TPA: transcription antitermination factor NusB [Candidatus Coprocola pullicola]|nr:transcription antitermination factor NusB [Candidatus Coprocola pullicola]
MNRRNARKNAFFLVFQMDFNQKEEFEQARELFFDHQQEVEEEEKDFILKETEGTKEHLAEIDEMISKKAKKWATGRMSKVDLAILRLAIYEICFSEEIPTSVAINEAIELAKKFSSDEAPSFINGILGSIAAEKQNQ